MAWSYLDDCFAAIHLIMVAGSKLPSSLNRAQRRVCYHKNNFIALRLKHAAWSQFTDLQLKSY